MLSWWHRIQQSLRRLLNSAKLFWILHSTLFVAASIFYGTKVGTSRSHESTFMLVTERYSLHLHSPESTWASYLASQKALLRYFNLTWHSSSSVSYQFRI